MATFNGTKITTYKSGKTPATGTLASGELFESEFTRLYDNDNALKDLVDAKLPLSGGTITGALAITGDLTVDTNTLFVDSVNHRVGFGTTAPAFKTQIQAAGGGNLFLSDVEGTNYEGMLLGKDSGNGGYISVTKGGSGTFRKLGLWTSDTERLTILANGNVSIGTTDPGNTRLSINHTTGGAWAVAIDHSSDTGYGQVVTMTAGASDQYGYALYANSTYKFYVLGSGAIYSASNISADSFTDRTPHYEGDALAEIMLIKGVNGEIDHNTLPAFARVEKTVKNKVPKDVDKPKKASKIKDDVTVDEMIEYVETEEIVQERDLGAMISILTVGIQQLNERLIKIEGKL